MPTRSLNTPGRKAAMTAISFLTLLLSASLACAQPAPDTIWTRAHGGSGSDGALSVQLTTDDGFIAAGTTTSFGTGGRDVWLVKADAEGDTLWTSTFGGSGDDGGLCVQQTVDGGYIVAAYTESSGAGGRDFWLIKTTPNGQHVWDRTYGGLEDDLLQSVRQTLDGGFILAGGVGDFAANHQDMWLIKTDETGLTEWDATFGGSANEKAYLALESADGGYILAGYTYSYGAGDMDMWLVKTDATGGLVWDETYGGTAQDKAYSLQQTLDGGYVLAGYTTSTGSGQEDIWVVGTDANGQQIWDEIIGGAGNDVAYEVRRTVNGGYILGGISNSYGGGDFDAWLVKLDDQGNRTWDKTVGGTSDDFAFAVAPTTDGGCIAAGRTISSGGNGEDLYLVRLASELSDVRPESAVPGAPGRLRNFPNPFNPRTTLHYFLPRAGSVTIKVYDMAGAEVRSLGNGNHEAGDGRVVFEAEDLPSGVYTCRMSDGTSTVVRKMTLLK